VPPWKGNEMSIEIITKEKEDTAWDKRITFTYEGETYSVLLHWDSYDGYDLNFLDGRRFISSPDWAIEWEENQQYGAESLEYTLDSLTEVTFTDDKEQIK
jgi:hypothetical protein